MILSEGLILDDGTRLDVDGVFIETGAKGAVELVAITNRFFQILWAA
jgi:hypothetical protein